MENSESKWGGKREGAGRKKNPNRNLAVTFKTSTLANERLNAYCETHGISRSEAITRILESL